MKRLILTSAAGAGVISPNRLAERSSFSSIFRFTSGDRCPSPDYLAGYFGAQGMLRPGDHWSDWGTIWPPKFKELRKRPSPIFASAMTRSSFGSTRAQAIRLQLIWLARYLELMPPAAEKTRAALARIRFISPDVRDFKVSKALDVAYSYGGCQAGTNSRPPEWRGGRIARPRQRPASICFTAI